MKKLSLCIFFVLILAVSILSHAEMVCFPSGNKTADSIIYTGRGTLCSIVITTDGINDCSVLLYDNTSASGTEILPAMTCPGPSSNSAANTCVFGNINLGFVNGVYVDMTVGGGGSCTYNIGQRTGH